MAGTIDDEVKALIDKAYDHCAQILRRDEAKLMAVVDFLLENETMSGPQFEDCMKGEAIRADGDTSLFDSFQEN